jgi:hypothetical protein
MACANWPVALGVISVGAFGLTFLLYAQEFQRGVADVGFVGATMVAQRRRRLGLREATQKRCANQSAASVNALDSAARPVATQL